MLTSYIGIDGSYNIVDRFDQTQTHKILRYEIGRMTKMFSDDVRSRGIRSTLFSSCFRRDNPPCALQQSRPARAELIRRKYRQPRLKRKKLF